MTKVHPTFTEFTEVGSVDVDAGCIWIGDPCYVLKDEGEKRPTDLGDDWSGLCKRFFDRSGYNARSLEWSRWNSKLDWAMHGDERWKVLLEKWGEHPDLHKRDSEPRNEIDAFIDAFREEYAAANPFTPVSVDTGVATFKHDLGHEGMGVMLNTFYGDGSYPVYIEYGEGGRPRRVLIDFDPGGDEDEEAAELDVAA